MPLENCFFENLLDVTLFSLIWVKITVRSQFWHKNLKLTTDFTRKKLFIRRSRTTRYFRSDDFLLRLIDFQKLSSFQSTLNLHPKIEIQLQMLPRLFRPFSGNGYLQFFHLWIVHKLCTTKIHKTYFYCGHYSSATFIFIFF